MESKSGSPEHVYETVYKTTEELRTNVPNDNPMHNYEKPTFKLDEKPALPPKLNLGAAKAQLQPVSPVKNKIMSTSMNEKIKFFSKSPPDVSSPAKKILSFIPFTGKSTSLPTTPIKTMINLWTADDVKEIRNDKPKPAVESGVQQKLTLSVADKTKDVPARPPRNPKKSEQLVEIGVERDDTGAIVYVTKDVLKPLPRVRPRSRRRADSDSEEHLRSAPSIVNRHPKTQSLERGITAHALAEFGSASSLNSELSATDSAFKDMSRSTSVSAMGSTEFGFDCTKPIVPPRRRRKSVDISLRISQAMTVAASPVLCDLSTPEKSIPPVYAQVDKSKKVKNRAETARINDLINKFETGSVASSVDTDIAPEFSPDKLVSSLPGESNSSAMESEMEANIRIIENSFASISSVLSDARSEGSVLRGSRSTTSLQDGDNFSRLVVSGNVAPSPDSNWKKNLSLKRGEFKTFLKEIQVGVVKKADKESSPAPSTLSQDSSLSNSSDTKRFDDSGSQADISDMCDSENPRSVRERIASLVSKVGNGTVSNRFSKSKSKVLYSESSADESVNRVKTKKFRTLPRVKSDKKLVTSVISVPMDVQSNDAKYVEIVRTENQRDSVATGSDGNPSILDSDSDSECKVEPEVLTPEEKLARKVKNIATEIVTSESVFVDCLKLLNNDFRLHVIDVNKEEKFMPESELNKLLCDLPQLLTFSTVLLCDLKIRLENWDTERKIADVIAKVGPFLKLYSIYIRDFEYQCSLFDEFRSKFSRFDQLTREFEKSEKCRMLGLKHYMLKPVQRIPQYRLLLQDYLDHLDESSEDYQDTVQALKIVSDVADHANNSVKQEDNFHNLLKLQSRLRNYELLRSGRFIRKEGELLKLSRKTLHPRYFILLDDCLLYTTYQGSPPSCKLRVNHELPLVGMDVNVPATPDYPNEFIVISTTRSLTLIASSPEERDEWLKVLQEGLGEAKSKRLELAARRKDIGNDLELEQNLQQLGKHAPVWIPDSRVTMCQLCCSSFSVTFRRHHCRACGKVVCTSCSGNQAALEYLKDKKGRVCDDCYLALTDHEAGPESPRLSEIFENDDANKFGTTKLRKKNLPSRLVEVCAKDSSSQMNGYLRRRKGHSWKRFWYVLKDRVLYVYRASEDVAALETFPVLGYKVQVPTEGLDGVEANSIFKLTHLQEHTDNKKERTLIFDAGDSTTAKKWINALIEATILRPDPV